MAGLVKLFFEVSGTKKPILQERRDFSNDQSPFNTFWNPTGGSRRSRRVSGGLNVARPFKAGAGFSGHALVASATTESARLKPKTEPLRMSKLEPPAGAGGGFSSSLHSECSTLAR